MYVERRSNPTARPGLLVAVIGVHLIIGYILSVSMGVIKMPEFIQPAQVVFIPEQQEVIGEPEVQVLPDIEQSQVENFGPRVIPPEEVIVPPAETPMPPSPNAIAATEAVAPPGPPSQELKTKSRVEPVYPPAARRAGEEGTVKLRILVDERGAPREVQVTQGSGFARLDQAAIEAVRKWRFAAATNGSTAITAWTQVSITFRLTNA